MSEADRDLSSAGGLTTPVSYMLAALKIKHPMASEK